jgi:hypothetical protein
LPPLEAWEKVYFDNEDFFDTAHATIGCITCHGGTGGTDDMEAAHQGVVKDPDQEQACGTCHAQTVESFTENGLHWNLAGYMTVLEERSDEEHMPQVMEAFENHCGTCHSSCGQCHVSRPTSNGGGLLDGHVFKGTPPPYTTCTGCHGSRIENEYKGKNADADGNRYPADIHYNPGGMNCNDCHTGEEMHGATGSLDHRYDSPETPSCTDEGCHEDIGPGGEIPQHSAGHLAALSCQVCHAVTYKNCYNCHVQQSEEGVPYFKTDESQMLFRIGLNPIQSEERPWKYVPVRHVPVARDSFAYYGEDLLPNYDSRPTWAYATPHAIQRMTPQNQGCDCHSNLDFFLTADDLDPDEVAANQAVIVAEAPAMEASAPIEEPQATEEPEATEEAAPTEEPEATEEPSEVTPTKEPTEEPSTDVTPPSGAYAGPQTCNTCHPDRYELWLNGAHANALADQVFQEEWAATDNAAYCLACHTTGYNPNTGEYALEAVTCEACHGPYTEDHPPAVVEVDRKGDVCRNCHPQAYDEWRASPHGLAGTRCVSCHQICMLDTMKALDGHAVCENCHTEDADHFHQGTHAIEGLDCTDCHMQPGPGEVGHGGSQHIAHVFTGNPESCIDCHAETIHIDNKIIDAEAQVATLQETGVTELQEEVTSLEEERDTLQANVAGRLYAGLVAGVIVGAAVGFGTGLFWKRWQRGRPI